MKILIVAATRPEVQPLINAMESICDEKRTFLNCKYKKLEVDFLISGVGMVAMAYHTGKMIDDSYDGAFNLGICGSYNRNLEIGTVVNIYEDAFSELGAEDGNNFLTLEDLKLGGVIKISNLPAGQAGFKLQIPNPIIELLPKVNGITVNTTHGNDQSIEKVFRRCCPMVESMEGAAFMFVCEQENIPYVQLRAVSNYVEKRNRDAWNIPLAIENLNKKALEIINNI
ncbi:MAG: futalosine hydrolase [Bacteroidota bacterium]